MIFKYNCDDLAGYHSVVSKPAFDLDVRNSKRLHKFVEKYDASIEGAEILIRKTEQPLSDLQPYLANVRALMDILGLAARGGAELEIFVGKNLPNYHDVAEGIKGFLEDKNNSANKD